MIKELEYKDEGGKDQKIEINPLRLKGIKDDVRTRNEIFRELIHNSFDAKASNIDIIITIEGENDEKYLNLHIKYYGENLKVFKDSTEILRSLFCSDISGKTNDNSQIGGKGVGMKLVLACCDKLTISATIECNSENNNEIVEIHISNPDSLIDDLVKGGNCNSNDIIEINKKNTDNNEKYVQFNIKNIKTERISSFEHSNLVKYIKYFTIMGNKGNLDPGWDAKFEGFKVKVSGLNKNKTFSENINDYTNRVDESEDIDYENMIEQYISNNNNNNNKYKFVYVKCDKSGLNYGTNVGECNERILDDKEKKLLKDFFQNRVLKVIRTQDKDLKKKIKFNNKISETDFFGIYLACDKVIVNYKYPSNTQDAGSNGGSNLFAQYFGYVYNEEILLTPNRNSPAGSKEYFGYVEKLVNDIFPIINKLLAKLFEKIQVIDSELEKMDKSKYKGLWGELYYIHETLKSNNTNSCDANTDDYSIDFNAQSIIEYWTSHLEEKRWDFKEQNSTEQNSTKFVEIKTKEVTAGNNNMDINVSTVEQLDVDESVKGKLIFYKVNKMSSKKKFPNIENSNSDNFNDQYTIIDLIGLIVSKLRQKIEEDQSYYEILEKFYNGIGNYVNIDNFGNIYTNMKDNPNMYKCVYMDVYKLEKKYEYNIDKEFNCFKKSCINDKIKITNGYTLELDDGI